MTTPKMHAQDGIKRGMFKKEDRGILIIFSIPKLLDNKRLSKFDRGKEITIEAKTDIKEIMMLSSAKISETSESVAPKHERIADSFFFLIKDE